MFEVVIRPDIGTTTLGLLLYNKADIDIARSVFEYSSPRLPGHASIESGRGNLASICC
jgi:hypothetical protein